jgi:hypothetical protein
MEEYMADPLPMDPRVTRSLGQIQRGQGRPTLISASEDLNRVESPLDRPAATPRRVPALRRTNRTQARGSRR